MRVGGACAGAAATAACGYLPFTRTGGTTLTGIRLISVVEHLGRAAGWLRLLLALGAVSPLVASAAVGLWVVGRPGAATLMARLVGALGITAFSVVAAQHRALLTGAWAALIFGSSTLVVAPLVPRRRARRPAAAVLVIALTMGLGAVGLGSVATRDGAGSGEAAVRGALGALERGDLVTAASFLAPEERDSLRDDLPGLDQQLRRLGLIGPTGAVGGAARPVVSALTLRPEPPGVYVVLGATIDFALADGGHRASVPPALIHLGTVERGGRFYVSLLGTLAASVGRGVGSALPARPAAAEGAPSPGDAVAAALGAASRLDYRGFVRTLDPSESRVLQQDTLGVTDRIAGLGGAANLAGLTVSIGVEAAPAAGGRVPLVGDHVTIGPLTILGPFPSITTVERGGLFYVAPLRTLADDLVAYLAALPADALDRPDNLLGALWAMLTP